MDSKNVIAHYMCNYWIKKIGFLQCKKRNKIIFLFENNKIKNINSDYVLDVKKLFYAYLKY